MTFSGPSSPINARVVALFVAFKVMLLVMSGSAFIPAGSGSLSEQFFSSVLSSENIVAMTNNLRSERGERKLVASRQLERAAGERARDMFERQYFAHTDPDGKFPWAALVNQKYTYLYAGENIGMRYDSAEKVIESWMESSGHRENILSRRYTQIGVAAVSGVYYGEPTTIVVQLFARPFVSPLSLRSSAMKNGRAAVSDSIDSSEDLDQLYGDERDPIPDTDGFVSLLKRIYFYLALFLLGDIVFRYVWLQHYRDRRTTLYTLGTFLVLLGTLVIG